MTHVGNNYPREKSINFSSIVLFMLFFYLVVDSVNGVIIREGGYSISVAYKAIMLLMIACVIRNSILLLVVIFSVAFYFVVHTLGNYAPLESLVSMIFLVRFFSIVMFFEFFRKIIKERSGEKTIYYFSLVCFLILAINLLLGAAGYGYTQYRGGGGVGTRGFIYSGNELAGTLLASASIILMYHIKKQQFVKYMSFGLMFIFLALLTATKVAILSSLMVFMFFPIISFISRSRYLRIPKKETYFLLLVLLLFPIVSYASIYFVLIEINLLDRLSHFYQRTDLITTILSGRNERVSDSIASYTYDYTILEWFFGRASAVMSEIDTVDVLVMYGITGVVLVYGFFVFRLIICLKSSSVYEYSGYVFFMIILLLMISTTAGHIVYSGTAGPLIAALLSMAIYRRKNSYIRCVE